MDMKLAPLIIILGPTGIGKTAMAINLAKAINGEVVSADSRYFYRGMDIGTAKPSAEELDGIPHHLIDVADPDQSWSLGKFKREAIKIIDAIHTKEKIPLLVGGTGQYLRAITEGWVIPEIEADETLREILEAWAAEVGSDGLHQRLEVIDPIAAENILPGNLRRTIRALEVIFKTGERFSDQRRREAVPYKIFQVGLTMPREELYLRVEQRVDLMIKAGFVKEVADLLAKGYSPELSSMSAIGYRQMAEHLKGEITIDEAIEETKRVTKKFVRRQSNWFKASDPKINWFDLMQDQAGEIENAVKTFLDG
ncbi:MAG: tRNA (adenosine(37)-N6)-dimethylallyltransferase MiaA [Chloroflexota bacterium]